MNLQLIKTSCMDKVFLDGPARGSALLCTSHFGGERFAFQYALCADTDARMRVVLTAPSFVTIHLVGHVPAQFVMYADHDDDVLTDRPGLFPDPLMPLPETLFLPAGQWHTLWVESLGTDAAPGAYDVEICIYDGDALIAHDIQTLTLLPGTLPPQELLHTNWVHYDCIAARHGCLPFDEDFWGILPRWLTNAADHGINCLLTPLFTPPLDTAVGGERTTAQLVGVEQHGDTYTFDFSQLTRFIALAQRCGITHFELSHLFTQWGAKAAPKIMLWRDGLLERAFGWGTPATGPEYANFLRQFLPQLTALLRQLGLADRVFFHVSDEPSQSNMESYASARALVAPLIEGFACFDALSDYDFYREGLVPLPVPSNDHIAPFVQNGVEPLWTYYCCGQYKQVANRFFCFPTYRNRILGTQMFLHDCKGFLHWGYNFYNTQYSKRPINPWAVTDAGGAFPAGDSFIVYPGPDGQVLSSTRQKVFHIALQDQIALDWAAQLLGREVVENTIKQLARQDITFANYPRNAEFCQLLRMRINAMMIGAMEAVQ